MANISQQTIKDYQDIHKLLSLHLRYLTSERLVYAEYPHAHATPIRLTLSFAQFRQGQVVGPFTLYRDAAISSHEKDL
jgi:hypothetical protein